MSRTHHSAREWSGDSKMNSTGRRIVWMASAVLLLAGSIASVDARPGNTIVWRRAIRQTDGVELPRHPRYAAAKGDTPLIKWATIGDVEKVRRLLSQPSSVRHIDHRNEFGETALAA